MSVRREQGEAIVDYKKALDKGWGVDVMWECQVDLFECGAHERKC